MQKLNQSIATIVMGMMSMTVSAGIPVPMHIETIFYCTTADNKEIQLYKQINHYIYQYGKAASNGKKPVPELQLTKSEKQIKKTPWPGMGSYIWQEISLKNGQYTYTIASSYERKDNGNKSAGVVVTHPKTKDIHINCDFKKPVIDKLDSYTTR